MSTADEPLLAIEDLEVHFENTDLLSSVVPKAIRDRLGFAENKPIKAVDDVSLDIEENEVVALVGESGCGKTTLGKTAVGLQRPTGGSVKYEGVDIWSVFDGDHDGDLTYSDVRRSLQIIHQDPESALNPNRTVSANLREPLKRWYPEMDMVERKEEVEEMLTRVGVTPAEDYASRYPHELSGGEAQRVALIRALSVDPDLVLADEAVSALDVSLRIEIMDLMLDLQDSAETSFIFISHNLSNARYFAGNADGRIAVMYLGEIVEIGPVEQIINDPQHPYTKVLAWATPVLDPEQAEETLLEEPPVRGVDIPDASDPPSGCRFHTRCPEAREACRREQPALVGGDGDRSTACFRQYDQDHPYWESDEL